MLKSQIKPGSEFAFREQRAPGTLFQSRSVPKDHGVPLAPKRTLFKAITMVPPDQGTHQKACLHIKPIINGWLFLP